MAAPRRPDFTRNLLFYGDNLDVMRQWIADESIDLVYLDPPFNSNRTYNVLFKQKSGKDANAQIQAFDDTWTWSQDDEVVFADLQATAPTKVADAITAMRQLIGPSDMLSYLVMMTARLIELRRVLKPTGSLYLHCDPVASHYLKVLLDAVFGPLNFRSEVIWKRSSAHNSAKRWGPVHDVLLFYSRSDGYTWNPVYQPLPKETADAWYNNVEEGTGRRFNRADLTAPGVRSGSSGLTWRGVDVTAKGRHWAIPGFVAELVAGKDTLEALDALDAAGRIFWPKKATGAPMLKRYLDESKGIPAQDVVTDVYMNNISSERLGYPTQKPLALLERIVRASSNEGDVVLDPFCGCGTAVDAAQRLGRRWIGIDISYLAVDLIETRLIDAHGAGVTKTFETVGVPRDPEGAVALFHRSPFDFERWAVSLVDGTPNERQVGDRGVDGVVRFPLTSANDVGRIVVSVKGGNLNPSMVRDLAGTVDAQHAAMGLLLTNQAPTRGMTEAAQHSGSYVHPLTGKTYPKVQILTVGDLLAGTRPAMPTPFMPYLAAPRFVPDHPTLPGMG